MGNNNSGDITIQDTCELRAFERNKYFYGKLMTVGDFELEQRYYKEKSHLLNRLIHGIGLVCGLEVSEPQIVNEKLQIKLASGVALDCCGREIVVENSGTFDVEGSPSDGLNYVYLKYKECVKDPVPSLANPSVCEEVCCYSRIKEDFQIEVSQTAPPAATPFDWQKVWQDRKNDILEIAANLGLPAPRDEIEAKFIITADEYFQKASCPSCDDPRVFLAVIKVTASSVVIEADETATILGTVYSNPMLHELLRSHLTDLDNPHQVTAEQAKALMSINNVGNSPDKEEWVQNINIKSPDGTITVTPSAANKAVNIKTTHAQINPLEVDPTSTDTTRDKHVSNDDANGWSKALVSIDGLTNPGGDIALVAGDGIKIEHPSVPSGAPPQIEISAAVGGATTGVVQLTIPEATVSELSTAFPSQPGYVISKNIRHWLETEMPPGVILGLVTKKGIIMEQDFITKGQIIGILAGQSDLPLVSFLALAVDDKKFNIAAVNAGTEEVTISIRWWAVPARQIKEIPIKPIIDAINSRLGNEFIKRIAEERNVSEEEAIGVIGGMMETIAAEPSGITLAKIAKAANLKADIVKPVLETLVESANLESTGSGATRRFRVR
jgi:hypothetical protein